MDDSTSEETENIKADEKRPPFGSRYLLEKERVFEHNAWDDVNLDFEQLALANKKITENTKNKVSSERCKTLEDDAHLFWDHFYDKHENKFFKDRHWLFTAFPELKELTESQKHHSILEVGCGAGNTIFPLIQLNCNPNLFIYCCDFSSAAIAIVKEHQLYDEEKCKAFVLDVTGQWDVPFAEESLDVVTLIFVLSAVDPEKMSKVLTQIYKYLKPGGLLLFRDYGRLDMAQLRFKNGSCIKDNFYVRGDGTRVYFFDENEVAEMFTKNGFKNEMIKTDRRLQVNRAKQLKMYRVWVFGRFSKN